MEARTQAVAALFSENKNRIGVFNEKGIFFRLFFLWQFGDFSPAKRTGGTQHFK
jgi:hypothetical protein